MLKSWPERAKDIAAGAFGCGALQKRCELAELVEILGEQAPLRRVLEIGGQHGGTLWAWDQIMLRPGLLVCIDMFVLEGRLRNAIDVEFTHIEADSHLDSSREYVKTLLAGELLDFLFIDGDHSYEGVRRDFEMYAPLVRPGGIVALHDVSVQQPARVRAIHDVVPYWHQLEGLFESEEIFDPSERWGGIGVLYMPADPAKCAAYMAHAVEMGAPTDEQRVATVPLNEPCLGCGEQLAAGEDVLCRACAV